jgi:hypothetical protein
MQSLKRPNKLPAHVYHACLRVIVHYAYLAVNSPDTAKLLLVTGLSRVSEILKENE